MALVLPAPQPAEARYNHRDAQEDCAQAVKRQFGFRHPRNVEAYKKGHNDYRVTGDIRIRRGADKHFTCKVQDKRIVSLKVRDADNRGSGSDHDGKVATAIGVGVLGLALAAAIASNRDGSKSTSTSSRNPFDDREKLKADCSRALERRLNADHGRVRRIRMRSADLNRRDLTGKAHVKWRAGAEADLRFRCSFDRHGRIADGTYRYISSR